MLLLTGSGSAMAQQDLRWIKHQMATLSSGSYSGRGYVNKGGEKAAKYLQRRFKEFRLLSFTGDSSYYQDYSFNVNTFPDAADLTIRKTALIPGQDYLVDAASSSFSGEQLKIREIKLGKVKTLDAWEKIKKYKLNNLDCVFLLKDADTLCRLLDIKPHRMAAVLPKGCFIIPRHGKLTWTVATDTSAATVFYVEDTVLPRKIKRADVNVHNVYEQQFPNKNVIGFVKGTQTPDSFIVFCAHYDHLGKMGYDALFSGASDNASGTALMLFMASYYAAHPQKYSMVFIGFSGEEAGLKGSEYFVKHPLFSLPQTRMVINLDLMGDATKGVTVVNATEYPKEFGLLQQLNDKKAYLPEIKSRGKAANSDHYHFSENGVPALFLYCNAGPGYYHDVFDRSGTISMKGIDKLAMLLQDFVTALQ